MADEEKSLADLDEELRRLEEELAALERGDDPPAQGAGKDAKKSKLKLPKLGKKPAKDAEPAPPTPPTDADSASPEPAPEISGKKKFALKMPPLGRKKKEAEADATDAPQAAPDAAAAPAGQPDAQPEPAPAPVREVAPEVEPDTGQWGFDGRVWRRLDLDAKPLVMVRRLNESGDVVHESPAQAEDEAERGVGAEKAIAKGKALFSRFARKKDD